MVFFRIFLLGCLIMIISLCCTRRVPGASFGLGGETSSKILDVINLVVVVVLCVLQHFEAPHYSFHFLNLS